MGSQHRIGAASEEANDSITPLLFHIKHLIAREVIQLVWRRSLPPKSQFAV